jgi:hypothetical protein
MAKFEEAPPVAKILEIPGGESDNSAAGSDKELS